MTSTHLDPRPNGHPVGLAGRVAPVLGVLTLWGALAAASMGGAAAMAATRPMATAAATATAKVWGGMGGLPTFSAKAKRSSAKKTKVTQGPERTASGETVANRERRLLRECKGRPNAGACLGFAN